MKFAGSLLAQKLLSMRAQKVREIHRVIPRSKIIVDDLAYKTGQVRSSFARSVFSKCEKLEPTDSSVEFQGAFDGLSGIGQMKVVHNDKR